MKDIIETIASLSECLIITLFTCRILTFKSDKFKIGKSSLLFIILSVNNLSLSTNFRFENLSVALMLVTIFVFTLIFQKGKIFNKILVTLTPTITILPINLIILNSFAILSHCEINILITESSESRIAILFFSKFLFFILCELILSLKRSDEYRLNKFQWIIQLSCFLISFFIANRLWNISKTYPNISREMLTVFVLIMIMNILLYVLLYKMQNNNYNEKKYKLTLLNLRAQEKQIIESTKKYEEIKMLRHDMKHCLMVINQMIANNNNKEAITYINELTNSGTLTKDVHITTGIPVIDAVINEKYAKCLSNEIEMKCSIDTSVGSINELDMSILLSNLLDNSIEAAKIAENKKVELIIKKVKAIEFIIIKNTISESVIKSNPELHSTKSSAENHGYGMKSIRKIVKNNNGNINIYEIEGMFVVEISFDSCVV